MLYQLDLRLKEIKQRHNEPFGGVAIFFFSDVLQLRPVQARYIFDEPICESYALSHLADPLWKRFNVIMLINNHRQGEDKEYADILNRIRVGEVTDKDIERLNERVRHTNDPDIPKHALIVTCKNEDVNHINALKLNEIEKPEYCIEAKVRSQTQKIIQAKTDTSGAIRNTPLQKIFKVKEKARVMLTFNIDTCDGLTNGTFGEVVGVEVGKFGEVVKVIVKFDDKNCGKECRKRNAYLERKFGSRATPIERIEFQYSLSKKATSASSTATAFQFPLRLAFAATAHKVQGATVTKPSALVVDLRSVREAAQAYVMLSRVQALSQLYIIETVPEHRIYSSPQALEELRRLSSIAMDNESISRGIISCNIRSLTKHYEDIKNYPDIRNADILCLQETWLDSAKDYSFNIEGMQVKLNSKS